MSSERSSSNNNISRKQKCESCSSNFNFFKRKVYLYFNDLINYIITILINIILNIAIMPLL